MHVRKKLRYTDGQVLEHSIVHVCISKWACENKMWSCPRWTRMSDAALSTGIASAGERRTWQLEAWIVATMHGKWRCVMVPKQPDTGEEGSENLPVFEWEWDSSLAKVSNNRIGLRPRQRADLMDRYSTQQKLCVVASKTDAGRKRQSSKEIY